MLYSSKLTLSNQTLEHHRNVFTFLDMLEDIGGILEIILKLTAILIIPISEHSFLTKAISKLYKASVPPNFFKEKEFKEYDVFGLKRTKPISKAIPVRIKL